MTDETPTPAQLRKAGRYLRESDPDTCRRQRLRSNLAAGRYLYESDPDAWERFLEDEQDELEVREAPAPRQVLEATAGEDLQAGQAVYLDEAGRARGLSIDRCPVCGLPCHATEGDEDGRHPACAAELEQREAEDLADGRDA